jgi:L-fuculose-phosphate aldolase
MTEADARREIARYAGLVWGRGLVAGSSGNISIRLGDGTVVATPTGRSLRAVAPDELVAVDPAGLPLDPRRRPTSELLLHLAAYRARPEIKCVIHVHPAYCVAWSKCGTLFPLDTVGAMESLGAIAFTRFARSGSQELADRCAGAFRDGNDTVVMERHGISSVGTTLEEAFVRADLAEQTAHLEYAARLLSAALHHG